MSVAFVGACRSLFGTLSEDCRRRLEAVIEAPSQKTWEDAYSIIVDGNFGTVWQAWCAIDANAPRSKPCDSLWPKVPDQLTIYRALQHAQTEGLKPGLS